MAKRWRLALLLFFSILLLAGLIGLGVISRPFSKVQEVTFEEPGGDVLHASYISGTQPLGVIMLEGFGSDQIALRPATNFFINAGFHVFSFDFSGHGRSSGGLGFDNAETDRLAQQVLAAKDLFISRSGLTEEQIVYFGHSMGARVALQAAVLDPSPPTALILLGTQLNLGVNLQSSFFTGTDDSTLEWVQALSAQVPKSHILLLSGGMDDIITPQAAQALYQKLTSGNQSDNSGYSRQLSIIPGLVHNYEIYSVRLLQQMVDDLEKLGLVHWDTAISLTHYYIFGVLSLFGFLGMLVIIPINQKKVKPVTPPDQPSLSIQHLRKFLKGKLLLWLAAIPVAVILASLFFLLPLNLPVFNLIYVGFIGGYGILMVILYLFGKVPGTEGKWKLKNQSDGEKLRIKGNTFWLGFFLWSSILLISIIITRSGLYYVIPINQRLVWVVIFSVFTAVGFWVSAKESSMVMAFLARCTQKRKGADFILTLIGLVPFFLYTLLMGILGSISGMIGGLQGLLILFIVIQTGSILARYIKKAWIIAALQSVLLYLLILPQGVLFTF